MAEARLEGSVPQTAGWFVANAADIPWEHSEFRSMGAFEGAGEARFADLGVALYQLRPGQFMALYHQEPGQEDFLVLRGTPLLIAEGEERALKPFDLVHCPAGTPHTIVGAGAEPALVLGMGARQGDATYPVEPAALRHGAGVEQYIGPEGGGYARFGPPEIGPAPPLT